MAERAKLDVMIDHDGRPWLLEVNAKSPACPQQGLGSREFDDHLVRFATRLMRLAMLGDASDFDLLRGVPAPAPAPDKKL